MNQELPDIQAGFRKGRGTRDQIANICWTIEKTWVPEKHLLLLYWLPQSLWLCESQQTVENSERGGNTRPPDLPPEKSVFRSRRNRTGHGTTDWFQIRKGVHQVYCHPAYLTYMHSTSCKMLNWMKHKLESRLPGEISITQICRWHHPTGRKWRRTKETLDESERGEWKSWLKTQHSKS